MNRRSAFLTLMLAAAISGAASQAQTTGTTPIQPVPDLEGGSLTVSGRIVPNAQATGTSTEPEGSNNVRFVRLSMASGYVSMDRQTGLGYEAAIANFPIVQGVLLKTTQGSAEVEFEDGSTLRLAPDTEVHFTQLRRDPTGNTLSTVRVLKGTVYASVEKSKGNVFALASGEGNILVKPKSHLRLEVGNPETRLSLITGDATFTTSTETRQVGKMKSLIFNTETKAPADLLTGIEDGPFDGWDMHLEEYHQNYGGGKALAGSGARFGLNDLNYYGRFVNLSDCGRVWRPYFITADWDPYQNGIWTWYPGVGYVWVSPYPWGWAPFHYGSWINCGAGGWGWAPGGEWYGTGGGGGGKPGRGDHHHRHHDPTHLHPYPPRPRPDPGKVNSMIAVNHQPLHFSQANRWGSFEFRHDSAGLGIPRGEFENLRKFSKEAAVAGTAYEQIEPLPLEATLHGPAAAYRPGSSDHPGYFHRPGEAGRQDPALASSGRFPVNAPASSPTHGENPSRSGYAGGQHSGSTSGAASAGYNTGSHGGNSASNGYSNSHNNNGGSYTNSSHSGGYSSSGSGYSNNSHSGGGGGGYSSGGYSGGSHGGGGGSSGGGYSGGSHASGSSSGSSSPPPSAPPVPVSTPSPGAPASAPHK